MSYFIDFLETINEYLNSLISIRHEQAKVGMAKHL